MGSMFKNKIVFLVVVGGLLSYLGGSTAAPQSMTPTDVRRIISNQPDFAADYSITWGKERINIGLAKQGKSFRREIMPAQSSMISVDEKHRNYKIITLELFEQPVLIIDPQERMCAPVPAEVIFPTPSTDSIFRAALMQKDGLEILEENVVSVDGNAAIKLKLRVAKNEELTIYIARDLKDLIVRLEGMSDGVPISFSMSHISMNVPQGLFDAPRDCQRVDFDTFQARVKQKVAQ